MDGEPALRELLIQGSSVASWPLRACCSLFLMCVEVQKIEPASSLLQGMEKLEFRTLNKACDFGILEEKLFLQKTALQERKLKTPEKVKPTDTEEMTLPPEPPPLRDAESKHELEQLAQKEAAARKAAEELAAKQKLEQEKARAIQNAAIGSLEDTLLIFNQPLDKWSQFPDSLRDATTPTLYLLPPASKHRGQKQESCQQVVSTATCRPCTRAPLPASC